jgi:hypothetical protein
MSIVRVSQISESLEAYMVVNFSAREINQGMRKLAQTPILIKNIISLNLLTRPTTTL